VISVVMPVHNAASTLAAGSCRGLDYIAAA
jgi:hypothetical protein